MLRAVTLGALVALLTAALAGGASAATVDVFPSPGTHTASPATQISFRGVSAAHVGTLQVVGSRSGTHGGRLVAHSDGQGASFLPNRAFAAGETVTVRTGLPIAGGSGGTFSFAVAIPAPPLTPAPSAFPPYRHGDVQRFVTRPDLAPAAVTITVSKPGAAPGYVFFAPQEGPVQNGPMIFDRRGTLVWFRPLPKGDTATDFRVQSYRGQPVLTWWQGFINRGTGVGEDVILDGAYRQIATIKGGNGLAADLHELQLTPQGTALITSEYPVWRDLSSIHGPKRAIVMDSVVQEIDIPTGLVRFEWHALDHVGLSDSYAPVPTETGHIFDHFHINSIQQTRDGSLLISSRHTWAVYDVDHGTGKVRWQLNGKRSSFEMGPGTGFAWQHDARMQSDGTITLFDDGAGPPATHSESRAIRLRLDMAQRTATLLRDDRHVPALLANYEGNQQLLPNGDSLVGWGQQPYFTEFDPHGSIVFDGHTVGQNSGYRAYRFPWTGRPPSEPAVAARTTGANARTVYASWNGATVVASWRVLAGTTANQLHTVATARKHGFETAIPVTGADTIYAVQALDGSGKLLSTSARASLLPASRVALFGQAGFVSPGGVAGFFLGCFGTSNCREAMTVTSGRTPIASRRSATIGAGGGGIVHLSLNATGLARLLHDHDGQIPVTLTAGNGSDRAIAPLGLVRFRG